MYADQTVVLGPLAVLAEPHTYDLCADHAGRLTPPRGWDLVKLAVDYQREPADDLAALVDAVQAPAALPNTAVAPAEQSRVSASQAGEVPVGERRRHLRVLPDLT